MSVLLLVDAKEYLNITVNTQDAEIQDFIDAAEAAIGAKCGPLATVEKTVRVSGGGSRLLGLPVSPAVSLASVTPYASATIPMVDLHLDTAGARITYNDGSTFDASYYDVVYTAGRTPCPDDLLLAVKELLRHLWGTQRGTARRPGSQVSTETSNTVPGAAYLFPFRVEQLILPHRRRRLIG
jgi:hypothetical protein